MTCKILSLIAIAALMTGCSSVYKSSRTPDDVYYSPARGVAANTIAQSDEEGEYVEYTSSTDDNYLRMKVQDRNRWSNIDDFDYWYDSRYYYNNYAFNSYYSGGLYPYASYYGGGLYNYYGGGLGLGLYPSIGLGWYSWSPAYNNNWYSPYYGVVYYKNPRAYASTSGSNLSAFRNTTYDNRNGFNYNRSYRPNSNSNFGSLVRRVFTNNNSGSANSNSSNSWDRPARTFSNNNNSTFTPSSNAGGRSGGYNSSGRGTGSRRP